MQQSSLVREPLDPYLPTRKRLVLSRRWNPGHRAYTGDESLVISPPQGRCELENVLRDALIEVLRGHEDRTVEQAGTDIISAVLERVCAPRQSDAAIVIRISRVAGDESAPLKVSVEADETVLVMRAEVAQNDVEMRWRGLSWARARR